MTKLCIFLFFLGSTVGFCIDDFYYKNNRECFGEQFPWATFPTKFWPILRVSSAPISLENMNISLLYFNKNQTMFEKIDRKNGSNLVDRNKRTVIITHGWSPFGTRNYIKLAQYFCSYALVNENINCMIFDWTDGASGFMLQVTDSLSMTHTLWESMSHRICSIDTVLIIP